MKRGTKFIICGIVALIAGLLFAAFGAESDSLGIVGGVIVEGLSKVQALRHIAGEVYAFIIPILGWGFTISIQAILKKYPTKWSFNPKVQDITVSWIWKLLAWLFGKSILYYNMKVLPGNEKALAIAKAKDHFLKHDPLLSLDLNKLLKS